MNTGRSPSINPVQAEAIWKLIKVLYKRAAYWRTQRTGSASRAYGYTNAAKMLEELLIRPK